jgi:hypothetical protein
MLQHLVVQPEGEPGHNHDHEAGDVDGHQVEGQLAREGQVNLRSNRGNLNKYSYMTYMQLKKDRSWYKVRGQKAIPMDGHQV